MRRPTRTDQDEQVHDEPAESADRETQLAGIDKILDEIDEVLEENQTDTTRQLHDLDLHDVNDLVDALIFDPTCPICGRCPGKVACLASAYGYDT